MGMFFGAAGAFDPDQLPGQVLVLDVLNRSVETSSGVLAANGDTVNRWLDSSSNAYHFLQGTNANKPVYRATGGLPYLEFDGSNDYLLAASASGLLLTTKTVYIVARVRSNPSGVQGLLSSQSGNWYVSANSTNRMTTSWSSGAGTQTFLNSANNAFNNTNMHRLCYTLNLSGSNVEAKHYSNGTQVGTLSNANGMTTPAASNFVVGAFSAAALFCPADISAVRVFNRIISDYERGLLDSYYSNR